MATWRTLTAALPSVVLALGLLGPVQVTSANSFACADPSNLCVDSGGAKWEAGKQATVKDKKKRSEKSPGTLSMSIEGGRGSLFVNGRYAGTAPLSSIPVASGRNDIQVRDGSTVLAQGVLTVAKGTSVSITVRHP